jgi:hypothetical protein
MPGDPDYQKKLAAIKEARDLCAGVVRSIEH